MKTPPLHAHPVAWLLVAVLASCSSKQKPAEPPPAPKPTAAEESQKSFQLAAQEQKELAEQAKRVDAARSAVLAAQQQLAKAQSQEEQERAKAQQLQQRASQHLQEAVGHAQQAQAGIAGMGTPEGMQAVAGTVAQATPSRIVLRTPGGRVMRFNVDQRTRVLLGSEQKSVTDIQQGADAQVAYDPKAGQLTALIVRVTPAESDHAAPSPPEGQAPAR